MACCGLIIRPSKCVSCRRTPATDICMWGRRGIEFHRCRVCGCVTHWAAVDKTRDRMSVNAASPGSGDIGASAYSPSRWRGDERIPRRMIAELTVARLTDPNVSLRTFPDLSIQPASSRISAAPRAHSRAWRGQYKAGAGGRCGSPGPRSFPSIARSSRPCARWRTGQ